MWAPYGLVAGRSDIEESWRLTSDSLRSGLAARIGASRCFLVNRSGARGRARAPATSRKRAWSSAFPSMLKRGRARLLCSGRGDQMTFAAALAAEDEGAGGYAAVIA